MSTQTNTDNGQNSKSLGKFLKGVKSELKKVIWPSKKDLISNTIIVIISVILTASAIWLLDSIFGSGLNLFIG